MKYEAPVLRVLTPAINAIQGSGSVIDKTDHNASDAPDQFEVPSLGVYADWE
jgi:hypothetical protein